MLAIPASGAGPAVQTAVAALQRQDYKAAELALRAELKLHPADAEALSLLGVTLDGQKKYPEALQAHQRALASAPRIPSVINNYGNHLLATGDEKGARDAFLKTVALDPNEQYANLQLAQLALSRKDGKVALSFLDHLQESGTTAIMRLLALDFLDDRAAAATFERLTAATRNNVSASTQYGWQLAQAGQFMQAETFLTQALALDPANFQLLYGLGVTASQAGHHERAREVLESAVRQQPNNVDALYALAFAYSGLRQPEAAIRRLAEAEKLNPNRADVARLLAVTAGDIRAHEDSVAAWERYMKLAPNDDTGRRERGFEKVHLGLTEEGITDLRWFVARHPDDNVGYYELGIAVSQNDPEKGLANLNRAIELKPDFLAARAARGSMLYLQGKPELALPDLEFAAGRTSGLTTTQAVTLDRLGQVYLALDRLSDAMPMLRKAAELAPNDSAIQLHLANALAEAGQTEESDRLIAKFRQLRPGGASPPLRGVVDFLNLSPQQRHDDYKARLEKTLAEHPDDTNAQLLYLKLLLADGQAADAVVAARRFAALKPGAPALAEAGHALIEARQFAVAKELLQQIPGPLFGDVKLDLAIAAFYGAGSGAAAAATGLQQLDQVAEAGRNANYYLARAQMLDAAGKPADAIASMEQALKSSPARADLYWQAAALMAKNHRTEDALKMLTQAAIDLPQEAQIPTIRGALLELSGKTDEALTVLSDAQRRWPEVASVWVAHGLVLSAHGRSDEARRTLETAISLGAHSPETWMALDAAKTAQSKTNPSQNSNAGSRDAATDPARLFLAKPPKDW